MPLCDRCHNLIHEKKAHVLSLKELTKRAFDKKRIPELYAIHFGIEEILKECGSLHNLQTLKKRYEEISQDKEYLGILFGDYDKERKEGMLDYINKQEIEPNLKATFKKIYGSL